MPQLTHPEDERGADEDDDPVGELESRHVEELLYSWHLDHRYLTNEDDSNDGEQSTAPLEVERTASRLEGTRIEEVEEVGHHEDREEERLLVC